MMHSRNRRRPRRTVPDELVLDHCFRDRGRPLNLNFLAYWHQWWPECPSWRISRRLLLCLGMLALFHLGVAGDLGYLGVIVSETA